MGEGAGRERRRWARKLDALVVHMVCGHCVKAQDGRGRTAVFNMENQQGPAVQPRELCSILCDNLMVARGKDGGRDSQGVWDGRGHTAVFNMENQQGPAGQPRELCAMSRVSLDGRGEWIHVHVQMRPFVAHLKSSNVRAALSLSL